MSPLKNTPENAAVCNSLTAVHILCSFWLKGFWVINKNFENKFPSHEF